MLLKDLLQGIEFTANFDIEGIDVPDINCDTRKQVPAGFLFMAIDGVETDGHKYIPTALEKGAAVIVGTKPTAEVIAQYGSLQYLEVKRETNRETWAILSKRRWGFTTDKLPFKLIAITGTDGKTTTTHFLNQIMLASGKNVGLIGTVGVLFNSQEVESYPHTTTPDAYDVYRFLRTFAERGAHYVVLEATSFGMLHKRLHGLTFDIAALTNLTHEHLNLHGSLENYAKAKAEVFAASKVKLINFAELQHSQEVFRAIPDLLPWDQGVFSRLDVDIIRFRERFVTEYNLQNLAVTLCVLEQLKDLALLSDLTSKISQLQPVKGRLNKVENDFGLHIFIDYAHTPHGVKSVLSGIHYVTKGGRILCVFGCEGKRDLEKRPLMGHAAADFADVAYLAPVDPRDEDPMKINAEIEAGWKENPRSPGLTLYKFSDRRAAVAQAINDAQPGDYVLFLGKGHEQTMNMGNGEEPYSDFEEVQKALAQKTKS